MSIIGCDNCGIKEAEYMVYDIENQKTLHFCSRDCYEEYRDRTEWLKQKSIEGYERMSEETMKDELLRKDKEQLVELYLQKCYDTNVETEQLRAENERLKKYETIYYLNQPQASNEDINKFKQNELHQCINISDLLKDNTKQLCDKIRNELFKNITFMMNTNQEYLQKAVCWQDIISIIGKVEKGGAE